MTSLDSNIYDCRCGSWRYVGQPCLTCAILDRELPPTKEVAMTTHLKPVSAEIVGKDAAKE